MAKNRTLGAPLKGRVALVAGATRGAGRGIARALAEAGATVYCTGRSVKGKPSPYGRPETIDETAAIIKSAGGTAIALRVDHTSENEVKGLFARILRDHSPTATPIRRTPRRASGPHQDKCRATPNRPRLRYRCRDARRCP